MTDTLEPLEKAIRASVLADSFPETECLLARYVAQVEGLLRSLPAGSDQIPALARRTHILFDWSGAMLQASREYAAAELSQIQLLAHYRAYAANLRLRAEA